MRIGLEIGVQLIVAGMHRSGTSVLARILNLMGAYMGAEGVSTGANEENPKGFWERRDIRALNDALLHSAGCDWNRVAGLDLKRIPDGVQDAFDAVAGRLLLEIDAHRPWFIKEPRLCVLLPAWRRHLEAAVIVNIYRDPVEVAASLDRRNGIPIQAGLELWEYYVRAADSAAEGLPAVTVLHSELMADPVAASRRLYRDLQGVGVSGLREPSATELDAFVDRRLHRERGSRADLSGHRDCRQARIYRALAAGDRCWKERFPALGWGELRAYEATLPAIPAAPTPARIRSSRVDPFILAKRIEAQVRRIAELQAGIQAHDQLGQKVVAHEREQAEMGRRLQALERSVAEQQDAFSEMVATLARERARSAELESSIAEVLSSNSWRVTAPARAVVSGLRALLSRQSPGASR